MLDHKSRQNRAARVAFPRAWKTHSHFHDLPPGLRAPATMRLSVLRHVLAAAALAVAPYPGAARGSTFSLDVSVATYLGDAAAQMVPVSVDVLTPDPPTAALKAGRSQPLVVVAGNGAYTFGHKASALVPGCEGDNATVLLLSGAEVLSVAKLPGSIAGLKASKDGSLLVAMTTAGVFGLDGLARKVLWHDPLDDVGFRPCAGGVLPAASMDQCKVAVGADGTSAVALGGPGEFHWLSVAFSPAGTRLGNSSYGKNHFNALAVSSAVQGEKPATWLRGGFFEDKLPSHLPVQVCSVFSTPLGNATAPALQHLRRGIGGAAGAFTMYDYSGKQLAQSQADTRVSSLAVLDDGQLYFAGRATGGNSLFRYASDHLGKPAPNVATDPYNTPYNLGGPAISYVAVADATTGAIKRGTFVLTREAPSAMAGVGKGNSFVTRELATDSSGNVYVAGDAADAIANATNVTVAGQPACDEGASLLILSEDLTTRRHWVTFCRRASAPLAAAHTDSVTTGVAVRGGVVAFVAATSAGGAGMITSKPLPGTAAPNGAGPGNELTGGYLVVLPTAAG